MSAATTTEKPVVAAPQLDYFKSATSTAAEGTLTLEQLIEGIQSGEFESKIKKLRETLAAGDDDGYSLAKRNLPAVSISGCCDGKRGKAVAEGRFTHSGFLQLDFDAADNIGWEVEEIVHILQADPRMVAAFVSPSGHGVKGIARIPADAQTHLGSFIAARKFFKSHNLVIDEACKDPGRLCFVSHDPAAWIDLERTATFEPEPDTAPELPAAKPAKTAAKQAKGGGLVITAKGGPFPEPPANGIHTWLMAAAWWCRQNNMSEGDTVTRIRSYDGSLRRAFDPQEVEKAVRQVFAQPWDDKHGAPPIAGLVEKFFYDGSRYYLDAVSQYIPMDQRSVVRHLTLMNDPLPATTVCTIQTSRFINYAGPLAGHPRGIHETNGFRILATSNPKIIQARAGGWPTLQAVIAGLLTDPEVGQAQVTIFLIWLKFARQALVGNRRRPGQVLALAGPRGCGKTLLIEIIEAALGGRRANPYPYFSWRTSFNGDLAGAELLAVDDDAGSSDIRARRHLAANIKSNLFAGAVRIEGKNKTAFTFKPCWRMVIAVNDEPEALLVLPPLSEDIIDKIILFRCHKRPLPMPAHTQDQREAFFSQLMAEIPAMLAWLEAWEIPTEFTEERCGVRFFHHPAIVAALRELSPEGQLLALIDTAAHSGALPLPWTGTAAELKTILTHDPQTSRDAEKLLGSWAAAAGSYLARLEGQRVRVLPMLNGITRWRIFSSGVVE